MRKTALCTSILALSVFGYTVTGSSAAAIEGSDVADSVATESPIKHVIILIGENRGLDHTFGVYQPKGQGQTISNILSKGIVNEDGSPGPNYSLAAQYAVSPQSALLYRGAEQRQDALQHDRQSDAAAQYQWRAAGTIHHDRQLRRHELQHRTVHDDSSGTGYSAGKCVPADDRSHWSADRRRSTRAFLAPARCRPARSCCKGPTSATTTIPAT